MENKLNNEEKAQPEKKKKPTRKIVLFVLLAIIAFIGIKYFVIGSSVESTDNAQLDADIVPVRASVPGYVDKVYFTDNQQVKKGDLLFTIGDVDLKARLAQAEAALENAKANLLAVKSNAGAFSLNANASDFSSAASGQNVESAKARLTKNQEDYKRMKNMFDQKAATQAQLDASKAELDIAKAQYDVALNQYKSSSAQSKGVFLQAEAQQAQITLAQAMIKQREAELLLAQNQLDNASVEAPCDGIVSKRAVEVGQYITVGAPMCSLVDNTNMWVTANFKETQLKRIKVGQKVEVKIDAYPDLKLTGKIESFTGATGAKFSLLPPDNSTGNFVKVTQRVSVRVKLDNKGGKEYALVPGLSAYIEVNTK
jgi:membrane fusion protein (multidrug efflux system)